MEGLGNEKKMTKLSKKNMVLPLDLIGVQKKSFRTLKKVRSTPYSSEVYEKNVEIDKKNMVLPLDLIGVQKKLF